MSARLVAAAATLALLAAAAPVAAQPALTVDLVVCPLTDMLCNSSECVTFKDVPTDTCMEPLGDLWDKSITMAIHLFPDTNDWHLSGWASPNCKMPGQGELYGQGSMCMPGGTGEMEANRNFAIISPIIQPCTMRWYNQTSPGKPVCDTLVNEFGVEPNSCWVNYEGVQGSTQYNVSFTERTWSQGDFGGSNCERFPLDSVQGKFDECVAGNTDDSVYPFSQILSCHGDGSGAAARSAAVLAAPSREELIQRHFQPRFGRDAGRQRSRHSAIELE